eukprot:1196121-Prorocentrum_minimum.AAC.1
MTRRRKGLLAPRCCGGPSHQNILRLGQPARADARIFYTRSGRVSALWGVECTLASLLARVVVGGTTPQGTAGRDGHGQPLGGPPPAHPPLRAPGVAAVLKAGAPVQAL